MAAFAQDLGFQVMATRCRVMVWHMFEIKKLIFPKIVT